MLTQVTVADKTVESGSSTIDLSQTRSVPMSHFVTVIQFHRKISPFLSKYASIKIETSIVPLRHERAASETRATAAPSLKATGELWGAANSKKASFPLRDWPASPLVSVAVTRTVAAKAEKAAKAKRTRAPLRPSMAARSRPHAAPAPAAASIYLTLDSCLTKRTVGVSGSLATSQGGDLALNRKRVDGFLTVRGCGVRERWRPLATTVSRALSGARWSAQVVARGPRTRKKRPCLLSESYVLLGIFGFFLILRLSFITLILENKSLRWSDRN